MKSFAIVIVALLLVLVGAMLWQHQRYLRARRDVVQDRQAILYGSSAFHVVTFVEARDGSDVITGVRKLRAALESAPGTRVVYAGQAAFTRPSSQLGPRSWDAVVLAQYPSRKAYDAAARTDAHRTALGAFADSYQHGMQRSWALNLMIPQALLGLRLVDILRGHWNVGPLTPMAELEDPERLATAREFQARLRRLGPTDDRALVVVNLTKAGTPEQQAADRSYALKMITRMAGLAHGPMHMGRAVTLEGDAQFDNVVIVYYPGVSYFADLVGSEFFQGIIGDKQLADTQAVPTVPILSRLDGPEPKTP